MSPFTFRRVAHLEEVKCPTLFPSAMLCLCDFLHSPISSKTLAPPPAVPAEPGLPSPDGTMPRRLPDEILEDVLRRLPPHEPAMLVRAALVSRRWCRLLSGPGFRRRFREFHRIPPMLGTLCNHQMYDEVDPISTAWFIPTTAFCTPRKTFWRTKVLDAHHGRVLLRRHGSSLVVWDPIADPTADKMRGLAIPRKWVPWTATWTAAVLCSAAGGACDHLDCHQGPFVVVFVSSDQSGNAVVYTYSSDAAAWSERVCSQQKYSADSWLSCALVGNSLYFGSGLVSTALKYDLELRQVSLVLLPSLPRVDLRESEFTTMDDGGLGLVTTDDSKLCVWSRKDTPEVDAKWESRVIELKTLSFPVHVDVSGLGVIGSGVGFGFIFMRTGNENEIYTIDLRTYEVKKVHGGSADKVIPYMSFYTPGVQLPIWR